ncbi:glycosyl transferase group 1, partial [filamentous cyanobacterium CCP4]
MDTSALGEAPGEHPGAVVFVFLEIFSCEGGIQSYIKDIFKAYLEQPAPAPADVFLLRDGAEVDNP